MKNQSYINVEEIKTTVDVVNEMKSSGVPLSDIAIVTFHNEQVEY